ncbi:MAG TPA: peptidoglycan-binding protein, partial [Vicinamibacteria bacterium]|nr:peptidoglycan-binding protein [Vicinamibacteria bacterium]
MSKRRIVILFSVLGVVSLAAAGSWLVGSNIQSPAEIAARTAPPTPSPILVPVEERVISSDVVSRGTARFGLPQSVSIVPSALKAGAGVIAKIPSRGTQLTEGVAVLIASGRPVFVLEGSIPPYRDLVPGIFGDDVRQLEEALNRLGFDAGPADGTYDERTGAAVAEWYTSSGWEPFGPTPEQLSATRSLERELAQALAEKSAADDAAAAAPLAVEAARASAERSSRAAAAELAVASAFRDEVARNVSASAEDRAEADARLELAQAAANAARLEAEVSVQAAIDAAKAAERNSQWADEIATRLAAELEQAKRRTGVQVPVDEIIFIPSLPVRVEQIDVVVGDSASGPVLKVTNNQLAIDSSLPLDEAPYVKSGMPVAIDEPALGIEAKGVVERVADTPGTDGVDGYHIYFEVRVQETPTALEGFSLRLTIPVETTGGAVTAVPISALSLAADGTSRVQVENEGSLDFVVVEPGLSADGFVEVTPV